MICLGASHAGVRPFEAEAAQVRILTSFRADFLGRHPTGEVVSELEYQGGTTSAFQVSRPLRFAGKPPINRVLDAMASDFRNWSKNRDYRKCDVLGISGNGRHAELIEVTTEGNVGSAIRQLRDKLTILRQTVNRIHRLDTDWQPAMWRPNPRTLFCPLTSTPAEIRYACYEPTARAGAPNGIVLYEVHALSRRLAVNPLPVDVQKSIRKASQSQVLRSATAEIWARQAQTTEISAALRVLAAAGAAAAAVVGIAMIIDPVPGDEMAAFSAAMAMVRIARGF